MNKKKLAKQDRSLPTLFSFSAMMEAILAGSKSNMGTYISYNIRPSPKARRRSNKIFADIERRKRLG
ncbi:MAG TPA: hypothetical protein VMW42_05190 [Desulfatiglandales bacterium]|nr:hypothetical protein [Desulfatiglandales bacterium]